ncbi:hypothetical protein C9426_24020 [Serratia sp. S1B]|nr:hypothetical protein C9426_24020 [Serratia sp. S1B]
MDQQTITWLVSSATTIVAGVIGAILFHCLAMIRENKKFGQDKALRDAEKSQARVFISIELVFLLESYAEACEQVASDDPWKSNEGEYYHDSSLPDFDLSAVKGDWSVLPAEDMYAIRSLPVENQMAKNRLDEINRHIGVDTEYCRERKLRFADLGRKALTLARQRRINCELGENPRNHKINSDLESVIERLKQEKAEDSD